MKASAATQAQRELLPARFWSLFISALAALVLVALPLTVIQLIDGLLFVSSGLDVARDLALFSLVAAVPALLLALFARLLGRAAGLVWSARTASLVSWALLLVPVVWICAWQFARTVWLWVRATSQIVYVISPEQRLLAALLMAAAFAWLIRRYGLVRLLDGTAHRLLAMKGLAGLVILAALLLTALYPPARAGARGGQQAPAAAAQAGALPDVLVISLDALTAKELQLCSAEPSLMPQLQAFARRSSCFDQLYAASNFTTPTTSTIESATLPWSHFATQPDAKMVYGLREHSVARQLRNAGYSTHMVTDNLLASPLHRGTHASFDSSGLVHTGLLSNLVREAMTVLPDTALPKLVAAATSFLGAIDVQLNADRSPYEAIRSYQAALALLDAQPAGPRQPVFMWVHSLPPHSPYLPPPSTKYKLLPRGELEHWQDLMPDNVDYPPALQPLVDKHRLRYREAIMGADAELGQFIAELQARGRLDKALVIITSDHGESFEKGFLGHAGPLLHNALIRIPLLIKLPGQSAGTAQHLPVSQADLAPTILDIAGVAALPQAEGRSLKPALEGQPLEAAPVFSMTMERQSRFRPITQGHYAIIDGSWKLILHLPESRSELFDLAADPQESTDLAATQPAITARLKALVQERLVQANARRKP